MKTAQVTAPASAGADGTGPIDVQMSLVTGSTIKRGEPVVLRYTVTNRSDKKIGWSPGRYNNDWFSLNLTDQTGKKVTATDDPRPTKTSGAFAMPRPFLQSLEDKEGAIVVTQRFTVPAPGRYTLSVHVHMPYAFVEPDEKSPRNLEQVLQTTRTVLVRDYVFQLVVQKADYRHLKATAESLRRLIVDQKDGAKRRILIEALFSMPEAYAMPSWEKLATETALNRGWVAEGLLQVRSPKAADLLAKMQWDMPLKRPTSPGERWLVLSALAEIHRTGSTPLRRHIEQLFAQHGANVSDVPGV